MSSDWLFLLDSEWLIPPGSNNFKKRVNKRGIEYGWDVAVYSSIEHIYGYDYVTSCYKDNPQDSWKQLVDYMHEMFPDATDKQIRKVLK